MKIIPIEKLIDQYVLEAIRSSNQTTAKIAQDLGVGRASLYRRLKRLGIDNKRQHKKIDQNETKQAVSFLIEKTEIKVKEVLVEKCKKCNKINPFQGV